MALTLESKVISRVHQPVEMQFQKRIASIPKHRFQQRKPLRKPVRRTREKLRLQHAFAELQRSIGIDDDAASHAHLATLGVELKRANRNIEYLRCCEKNPIAPVYTPRGCSSSSASSCIARTFGAPVIDPQGNSALKIS